MPYGQYAPLSPYFARAQYGLLCRPIAGGDTGSWLRYCPTGNTLRYRPISLALNTGSCIALSPVGDTGSLSPRGCAPLTPGCILAPLQGARGSRIWQIAAISRSRTVDCAIKCFVIYGFISSMTCDMDAFLRKSAIFFSYHTLLQHLIHQLLIAVYMVVCHKTI